MIGGNCLTKHDWRSGFRSRKCSESAITKNPFQTPILGFDAKLGAPPATQIPLGHSPTEKQPLTKFVATLACVPSKRSLQPCADKLERLLGDPQ